MTHHLLEEIKQDLRRLKLNDMADILDHTLEDAAKNKEGYLTFFAGLVKKELSALSRGLLTINLQYTPLFHCYNLGNLKQA